MGSNLNFADMWGRVYLARLCSALIFAEWTSTQTFVEGLGAPFLKMLVTLATRHVLKGCAAPLERGRCNLLRPPCHSELHQLQLFTWPPAVTTGDAATSLLS